MKKISILIFLILIPTYILNAAPVNDNCTSATLLTTSATCSYTTYNESGATASPGSIPDPYCTISPYSGCVGSDVWFKVVVPISGFLDIKTKEGGITMAGMAIYSGTCGSLVPLDCVDSTNASGGYMPEIVIGNLTPGSTIYIRFWPECDIESGTFGICVTTFNFPTTIVQAPCTNLGFENGFTGWTGTEGTSVNGALNAPTPTYIPTAFNETTGSNFALMTSGTDPLGGFPVVYSGTTSLKLGNWLTHDQDGQVYTAASIEQTFQVTASNSQFNYSYAVVLQDGGHATYEEPFFQVDVKDQNGNPISCGFYQVTAPGNGFIQTSANPPTTELSNARYYKPWTTVSVNLIPYIGTNVTVRFTSSDCTQGGHYGYAYIECSCAPYGIIAPTSICKGGSATLTAPAGSTYSWNPGGLTTQSITVSPTTNTTYTCDMSSQGNTPCYFTLTSVVTVSPCGNSVSVNSGTVCQGSSLVLTAVGSGGATPYTFSWSPSIGLSATSGNIVIANPTTTTSYTVIMTDNFGATSTAIAIVNVNTPPTLTATGGATCAGSPITVTAGGANTYTWSNATIANSITVSPATATTYTVTGTDGNGCTNKASAVVTINASITINVTPTNPSICSGQSSVLTAPNGVAYTWTGGATTPSITVSPVATTTYYVTGVNGAGCTGTGFAVVVINPNPTVTATGNTICQGAAAAALTVGGANSYTWSNATVAASINVNPGATTVYTVTGASVAGCTNTAQATITVNLLPTVSASGGATCAGSPFTITAAGANTYTWSTGPIATSITVSPLTTSSYYLTGTDVNGCTNKSSAIVTINPTITIPVTPASPSICLGQSTILTASNGSNYTWTGGATTPSITVSPVATTTYSVTGVNAQGCSGVGSVVVTFNPNPTVTATNNTICIGAAAATLTAGGASTYTWSNATVAASINVSPGATTVYTVTGASAAGCTNTAQGIMNINPLPIVTASSQTTCAGSPITVPAAGANTYTWNNATIAPSITVSPLISTNYSVTGTDINGCKNIASASVSISSSISINTNPQFQTICNGGNATISASNGVSYTWSDGSLTPSITVNPVTTTNYFVTGVNAQGCSGTGMAVVTVAANPNVSVASQTICFGATANLLAIGSGGTPGYTYTWNNSFVGNTLTTGFLNTTTAYTVTVYDANGCVGNSGATVNVAPALSVSITPQPMVCGASGSATAVPNGGTPGYTYLWANGGQTSVTIPIVISSNYSVTVTDALGCKANTNLAIGGTPALTITSTAQTAAGCLPDGSASVTTSDQANSTFLWNTIPAQTGSTILNVNSGVYNVVATDITTGCLATVNVAVSINSVFSFTSSSSSENCNLLDGKAWVENPKAGYTYLWSNGSVTDTITGLSQGVYQVIVYYGSCIQNGSVSVGENPAPIADFAFTPSILTNMESQVAKFTDLSTQTSNPITNYIWNFGDSLNSSSTNSNIIINILTPQHDYTDVGTYTVNLKIIDSKGCTSDTSKQIIEKDFFTIYIPNAFSPNGDGINDYFPEAPLFRYGNIIDASDFTMIIFDRFGEIIYSTNNINQPWNGKFNNVGDIVQVGTYVYRIVVKEVGGPKHNYIGKISVVR